MSKRKQILLILAGMAVLLAALGILLGMVLSSDRQQNQPVAEDTVSDGEKFLPVFLEQANFRR